MPRADDRGTTVVVVTEDGSEVVVGRVCTRRPDLAFVDALVRLQLAARRRRWVVRLDAPSAELLALLDLVGLSGVLAVEAGGQPELGEQLRVEEVVQPDDPPV